MVRAAPIHGRALGYTIVLVLAWLIPVAIVFILMTVAGNSAESLPETSATTITVGQRDSAMTRNVSMTVNADSGRALGSPDSGLVTGISVAPGSELSQGVDIISIGGVMRVAMQGSAPFYRDLQTGMFGPDVRDLITLLSARTCLPAATTGAKVTAKVSAAIECFQRQIGAEQDSVFRTTYAIFVPAGFTRISSVTASIGRNVDADEDIASAEPKITRVTIASESDSGASGLASHPVTLTAPWGAVDLPEFAVSFTEEAIPSELASFIVASGLVVEGKTGESIEIGGLEASLTQPILVGTLPRTALYQSPLGALCVFTGTIASATPTVIDTMPLSPEIGIAYVPVEMAGVKVIDSPATTLSPQVLDTCTS